MWPKKVLMWIVGVFYMGVGVMNLLGLAMLTDLREEAISPEAMAFRYVSFIVFGSGMLLLRKWSAYVFVLSLVANWIIFFVV